MIISYFSNYPIPLMIEIVAAAVATITFIIFRKKQIQDLIYITIYLWIVVFVENLGIYSTYICDQGYDEHSFFINNPYLVHNYWLFNIYSIVTYSLFVIFFFKQFASIRLLKKVKTVLFFFLVFSMIYMLWTGIFIRGYSKFIELLGLVLFSISIGYYYFKLLTSNDILSIGRSFPFFISIATLLFFLTMTPLFISSEFIKLSETVFTEYYRIISTYANYFLYGIIIFGIVRCYWFNKSQNTKFSSSPTLS